MTDISMKEAMYQRHMVRRYKNQLIPENVASLLKNRAAGHNEKYHLDVQLVTDDTSAFHAIIRLVLAKGVKNYFIMAGEDTPGLDERLGYSGADLMLYAQTLGLNTWWVGGTFNRNRMSQAVPGRKVSGVIAVGYGVTQGTAHKSKKPEDVSAYAGNAPQWFQDGVKAALLAPTALAKQAFFIKGREDKESITCDNGIFTGVDKGLVSYHFELGAGRENFRWD